MTNYISVHITTSSRTEAEVIAQALLQEKLVACVNILPSLHSMYRWQGKVEKSEETLMIVKTQASLYEALEKRVKTLHSYECPCIVAMPLTAGYQPYLDWIKTETT